MAQIPNIQNLNKAFESRIRLGIMSVLMVNDSVDFNRMKELLQATDGNIASHVSALEKEGFIHVKKEFVGKKPLTTYSATKIGIKAFEDHLNALEKIIKMNQ
ncbi:MAG: winged helix-turn-helix domain-containing protein [Flavobacteriia bacterium]|jgi:predicted transcriptional regulator